jgi:dsDNA-specific endonuclease/ATPase MutS2
MNFKIGDRVSVLDDNISGVVIKISENSITIESTDGFDFEFQPHELLIANEQNIASSIFKSHSIDDVIKEKEISKKRNTPRIKPKERTLPTMEVDLHIHQLTNSNKKMNNYDMLNLQLETAKRQLEFAIKKRIQKLVFIHGVGEGVLKAELEYMLSRYDNVKYYDADFQKYGLGATEVYIYQNTDSN